MSLHTVVPSTPGLDRLVAAVPLEGYRIFPVKEGTILYEYAWSNELEEVKKEVFRMVCSKKSFPGILLTD
jgi:hypothetical protein